VIQPSATTQLPAADVLASNEQQIVNAAPPACFGSMTSEVLFLFVVE
jgi:hypothetical protein